MYIPKYYEQKDKRKLLAFMQEFSFAVMVTEIEGKPMATHLPFIIEEENKELVLYSHLSLANPHWQMDITQQVLVIFSEPHAYISPTLYEHHQNVPTWNYIAVHAYGKATWFHDDENKLRILKKQMTLHEASYLKQFDELPQAYVHNLLKGIVAFKIDILELQGKEKISQDKTETERKNIREHLINSDDTTAKEIGKRM